ncbi:MAG: hypothetical protein KDD99_23685, partial [Bacteroidetes bacterium]|nr:hypothetical protein [Bacteroidota bacterium]
MKRHGHLFERLCDFGHLYHAFRKAIKGSGHTMESRDFWYHLEYELLYLSNQLRNGFYTPSPYRQFQIYEPKKRIISVAPFCDRVVHHAVVMLLESIFDPTFVFHSYATRKGKGTQAAILQAQ